MVGIDRNIGQVAIADGSVIDEHHTGAESPMVRLREQAQAAGIRVMQNREGLIFHAPGIERLEERRRHYQRMMARRKKGSNRHAVKPACPPPLRENLTQAGDGTRQLAPQGQPGHR